MGSTRGPANTRKSADELIDRGFLPFVLYLGMPPRLDASVGSLIPRG
jgi:hypothetical protein